jgi:polysaccharide export outer membrane protein
MRYCMWVVFALLGGFVGTAYGQNLGMATRPTEPVSVELLRRFEQPLAPSALTLEGPIDPYHYRVGPGDQFTVTIGGTPPQTLTVEVSATGSLVLPEVGTLSTNGRLLAEVQETAQRLLKAYYRHVPVEVTLSRPRMFYVHVTGAVPSPGRFLASATTRVSDILQQALAALRPNEANTTALGARAALTSFYQPSLRNVRLHHRNGETKHLDLVRYYVLGDLSQNPYLTDGDVLEIPTFHTNRDVVFVFGEVPYAGLYDYRAGDTLLDVLLLAAGKEGLTRFDRVRLTRPAASSDSTAVVQEFTIASLLAEPSTAPQLKPGDHLQLLVPRQPYVLISGAVRYPGSYPIIHGQTTLAELIEMAGGLTPQATPRFAYIERQPPYLQLSTTDTITTAWLPSQTGNLDVFAKIYFFKNLQQRWLLVDLQSAQKGRGPNTRLFDGDRVYFPEDRNSVLVIGHVPRPGYVPYVPGQPARYYVLEAGGAGPRTRRIYVFNLATGNVDEGLQTPVASGDVIFVDSQPAPDTPEMARLVLEEQTSRRLSRVQTTQVILSTFATIAGIITAYAAITR